MRIFPLAAIVLATLAPAGPRAQEQGRDPSAREALKAACERDARLVYRTGSNTAEDVRQRLIEARRAYVKDCIQKGAAVRG